MNKKLWWLHAFIILIILAVTCGPLTITVATAWVAEANNCTLHEGYVNPCIINGRDYGSTLYGMSMMGWIALASIPMGIGLFALYISIVFVVWFIRRANAHQEAQDN